MENLIQNSQWLISKTSLDLVRGVPLKINWEWRLNGITGARGCGKTTRLLQQARIWQQQGLKVLYITLDDFYFSTHRLFDVASTFSKTGGQYLLVDEVHKYEGWSKELKNIYDLLPDLKVTFTGSSIIQITEQDADLSRRALMYQLPGLSFREYLQLAHGIKVSPVELNDLLNKHENWTTEIIQQFRPLAFWNLYLTRGYFPLLAEKDRDYLLTVLQLLKYIIEVDFPYINGYQAGYSQKIQAIMRIISQAPPFIPNISKLAEQVGITRNTMVNYLHYMDKALLTKNLFYPGHSISHLQKPDKVLLSNPNLYYALAEEKADKGSLRESAFVSMLSHIYDVHLHVSADFSIGDYCFEIGGRKKGKQQIEGMQNAFVIKDDIETGMGNIIPLWAFGFLY
jgi:hypothetical protein